ncbi:DUF2796 domain-containing protein [Alteromonas sp. KUL49]|nr:DUF2796 domain-containing protein [Alteromonas sp. KUL49]
MTMIFASTAHSQSHVHDQGTLFIGQDSNTWTFQFVLPAANGFGFEHLPESQSDLDAVNAFISKISEHANSLTLPSSCELASFSESFSETYVIAVENEHEHHDDHDEHEHHDDHDEHEHHDDHDEHEHHDDHDEHEHHDDHDDHEGHSESTHNDLTFQYVLECSDDSPEFSVTLFENALNLHDITAQWITETGQGAIELTPQRNQLNFGSN